MAGSKGSVVLLVGPSCAGKSTLAATLQALSPTPYLSLSLDGLFASVPGAWASDGERAEDGLRYEWLAAGDTAGPAIRRIVYGPVGWNFLQGFHRGVAAHADAGVQVVVDDMLLDLNVLADWASALAAVPTLLVSVTAPRQELLRREQARQVHPTPGLVAGHFELHHDLAADIRIDTSMIEPEEAARLVLLAASAATPGGTLQTYRRR